MILNTPIAVSDAKQKVCCDVVKSCQSKVYFFALFLESEVVYKRLGTPGLVQLEKR